MSGTEKNTSRLVAMVLFAALLAAVPFHAALAATAPDLRSASGFAVLAGTAVTCTDGGGGVVTGDVGEWPGTAFTNSPPCTINGTVHLGDGVAKQAYKDFINAYDNLLNSPPACDSTYFSSTLDGVMLTPGVYCVDATAKTGTLTLLGSANDVWIFLVDGALTGTDFNVVMKSRETGWPPSPCNVYWVAEAATLTTSNFVGTILSGAAITVTATDGTFQGGLFATNAVTLTLTNSTVTACGQAGHTTGSGCNQGVGNGPEGCDPGNSNQGDPSRSNDEQGGKPGNPGRKGGNGK